MAAKTLTIELELRDVPLEKYVDFGSRLFDVFFYENGYSLE